VLARLLPRIFALLRRVRPIVSLRRYALVTRPARTPSKPPADGAARHGP